MKLLNQGKFPETVTYSHSLQEQLNSFQCKFRNAEKKEVVNTENY